MAQTRNELNAMDTQYRDVCSKLVQRNELLQRLATETSKLKARFEEKLGECARQAELVEQLQLALDETQVTMEEACRKHTEEVCVPRAVLCSPSSSSSTTSSYSLPLPLSLSPALPNTFHASFELSLHIPARLSFCLARMCSAVQFECLSFLLASASGFDITHARNLLAVLR